MSREIVIVGAGGHAKTVIEAIRALQGWRIVGLVADAARGTAVLGVPILGDGGELGRLRREGLGDVFVAVGDNAARQRLGAAAVAHGFAVPSILHPAAIVSPSARIGSGVAVLARAVVGTETVVEDFAVVNTAAVVEHDGRIGPAAHVAPGCALAGAVTVGARALVGVGSAVRPGIRIGADALVGAGAAVVADVPDGVAVGGVPARPIRRALPG
jgi:UDP-perosamine 4-acetyltransferase